MTAGQRPVVLAVDAKTVVSRRAATVKGMAAKPGFGDQARTGFAPRHEGAAPARSPHLRSQGQASRLFRTTPASARPVPRADR